MIFELACSALDDLKIHVAGFKGSEKISSPYEFDVYFTIDLPPAPNELDLDLDQVIFSPATLKIALGDPLNPSSFAWGGLLASIEMLRMSSDAALFRAKLVPQLWQLNLSKHSRIWTKKTMVEVLSEVLDESNVPFEFRTTASYPVEEHISQYKESNLDFFHRWLEREGLYYYFEQTPSDDGQTCTELLVITDNKSSHVLASDVPINYHPGNEEQDGAVKRIFDNFASTHIALPASVKLIDYDYARPLLDVSSSVSVDSNAVGELAEYGGRIFSPEDAQRIARVRAEDLLAKKRVFYATGGATGLCPGYVFKLAQHPMSRFNEDEYLVTAIEHYGYDSSFGPAWGSLIEKKYEKNPYRIELHAITSGVQFRTGVNTAWPRIDGYENAIVDGAANSEYAQIDNQGRYAVKFKYDEGTLNDGKGSTWVRMAQPHGGPQEGMHFPLRKGVEVICSFLGGDPDRPVISGVVHNQLNQSTVTSSNNTQNVLRTGSLNHIVIEDQRGQMSIDIFCPIFSSTLFLGYGEFNFNLTTMGNGQVHTEINLQFDINNEWMVDVVNNVTWDFHNELTWTVTNNVTIDFNAELDWHVVAKVGITFDNILDFHVKNNVTVKFDALLDCTVKGNATYLFKSNVDVTINGNLSVSVKGTETHYVKGDRTHTVDANEIIKVGGDQNVTIDGYQDVQIKGPWSWIKKADSKTLTYGIANEMFLGMKNSIQLGVFNEATIALKNSLQVGMFNELTIADKNSFAFGSNFQFSGAKNLSISAVNMNLTGLNMALTGVSITKDVLSIPFPGTELGTKGPVIMIAVIEIHI